MRPFVLCAALVLLAPCALVAQAPPAPVQPTPPQTAAVLPEGFPVSLEGQTLFTVRADLGPFSAEQRAQATTRHLEGLVDDPFFRGEVVERVESELGTSLRYRGTVLFTVTDEDARIEGTTREQLVTLRLTTAVEAVKEVAGRHSVWSTPKKLVFNLVGAVLLLLAAWMGWKAVKWVQGRVMARYAESLEGLGLTGYKRLLPLLFFLLRLGVAAGVVLLALPLLFRVFPMTYPLAVLLGRYVLAPLGAMVEAALAWIPDLLVILLILLISRILLLFTKATLEQVEAGRRSLEGISAHWARTVYKIARFVLIVLTLVVIYPYIPGSESPAFKGLSLFFGALVTFGASSSVSTFLHGLLLLSTAPFQVGDRVLAAGVEGDVVEMTLFVTRIRTIKNEVVTVPNSSIMAGPIQNFSALAQGPGLILHTEVTIGYDAPWREVHKNLLEAARRTEGLEADPAPFVLQTALNDFYVTYQLNANTRLPNQKAELYARLHQNIQDAFNEAGMEIMSPHYASLRDGNAIAIPEAARPEGYRPPRFRVGPE